MEINVFKQRLLELNLQVGDMIEFTLIGAIKVTLPPIPYCYIH
jgi:hypothetical protein